MVARWHFLFSMPSFHMSDGKIQHFTIRNSYGQIWHLMLKFPSCLDEILHLNWCGLKSDVTSFDISHNEIEHFYGEHFYWTFLWLRNKYFHWNTIIITSVSLFIIILSKLARQNSTGNARQRFIGEIWLFQWRDLTFSIAIRIVATVTFFSKLISKFRERV